MSGEMTEFRITSDLAPIRAQVIDANFTEVAAWLNDNLAPYRNIAVTPDTIPTAKTYRAAIRKVRDRIDEIRKEAKAAALAAYSPFEARCKELTSLCDEAAGALDLQIKEYEQREADEKIERIRDAYYDLVDDELEECLPWGCVNNPKWRNKGFSFNDAVEEIQGAILKTQNDLIAIRENGGEDTPYLLDLYKQSRDLSAVIRKAAEFRARREREEQKEKAEAERRAEAKREEASPIIPDVKEADEEIPIVLDMVTVTFRVTCTNAQLTALGRYMRENGIKYGRA